MSNATRSLKSADNRPSDAEIDRRNTKHFGYTVAELDAAAKEIAAVVAKCDAAAASPKRIVLATPTATVTFEPNGDTVAITRTNSIGPWNSPYKEILSRPAARRLYAKLIRDGFYVW